MGRYRLYASAASTVSWPHVCFICLSAPLLPASLLFCSSKADYCLSTQPPQAVWAPNTTTTTAVLAKNKRESVRHLPLDLFHTRAPTSVPDGVAFFQGFCQPQESSKWKTPPPPPSLGAHYSAASHPPAPPPRAPGQGTSPFYLTATGSPIKTINHVLFYKGQLSAYYSTGCENFKNIN